MPQFPPGSPFEEFFKDFFERQQRAGGGKGPPRQISSLGSGFIVDARGYVVNNNHVIADADHNRVLLHDNTELEAQVVGRALEVDVDVLKVEPKKQMTAEDWGNAYKMR